jgi:hypothetical protein
LNHAKVKHLTFIFIPSTKKRDVTKCTINCRIAPLLRANKILMRSIPKTWIAHRTWNAKWTSRIKKRAWDKGGNSKCNWIKRAQGSNTKMSYCFIDYTKDFDSVQFKKNVEQYKKCGNNRAFDSVNMRPTDRVRSQLQVDYVTTE